MKTQSIALPAAIEYDQLPGPPLSKRDSDTADALVSEKSIFEIEDAVACLASAQVEGYVRCDLETARKVIEKEAPTKDATSTHLESQLAVLGIHQTRKEVKNLDFEVIEPAHVLALHDTLLADGASWEKGQLRDCNVYLTGIAKVLPPPEEVPDLLAAFCQCTRTVAENAPYRSAAKNLTMAAALHQLFEGIHPFVDGNGRLGRVLLFSMLERFGFLEEVAVSLENRYDYYTTLDEAPSYLARYLLTWMGIEPGLKTNQR